MASLKLPVRAGHSKKDNEKKRPSAPRKDGARLALGVGTVLILSLLLSIHLLPDKVSLRVGDVSPEEIRAHRTVRYVDTVETSRLRQASAEHAEKVYIKLTSQAGESVSSIFEILRRARVDEGLPTASTKIEFVKKSLSLNISDHGLNVLLTGNPHAFDQIEKYTEQLIADITDGEIRDDSSDVADAKAEFGRSIRRYLESPEEVAAAIEISNNVIKANRIYDPIGTKEMQRREMQLVPVQYRQIFLGEVVMEKGERVTPAHIDKFLALGLSHPQVDYITMLCISLLVAFVVGFAIMYIARYHGAIFSSTKFLGLLSLIVVLSVLGLKLGGTMLGLKLSGVQFGYFSMIWICTAGMLTAILLNPQLAVLVVAVMSTTSVLAMNHELRWALAALVSSLVAIYSVSDIRHRSDLMRAAGAVCIANLAVVWLIGRISGDMMSDLLVGSAWAVAGGFSSIGLFWIGTAALEKPFGITTHIRLLELSDTNNPILKRLLMEAPGTYSHSIFVGNIASAAAEVIGADALLVRVAAYYHDVGKMRRPHFFVENQHVENAHDGLNPTLSALVIRSHTKDGLELATEYKLPPIICELMSQHHGTSLVRYFYHQATEDGSNDSAALEQQFRYEGVKPQTKEAALLMIADAMEAASRCLSGPTLGCIENMVDEIISEKLTDGQLDESELTFKDVSRIRESFIRTLTSMLHARIEYPESSGAEDKKKIGNGSAGKGSSAGTGRSEKADKGRQEITAGN